MTKTCLLITDQFEPTADLLLAELRQRNVPCVRWNLDRFPAGSSLTFRACDARFGAEIISDGRKVEVESVGSIWCRGFRASGLPDHLDAAERKFAEREAQRALDGLMTTATALWINHPQRQVLANSKPAQIFAAIQAGFEVPPTLISNDPQEVRQFIAESNGDIVYKALSQALNLERGKALFTGLVGRTELAKLDLIQLSPGIFQKFVQKSYEVRATVVGSRIFSGRIDSQKSAETMIDWRHKPFDIDEQPIRLPSEIEEKIHALMRAFGLVFGALDFIVTPDGRHVFLEINPAGQYMWVEAATGLPITAALADMLSDACRS